MDVTTLFAHLPWAAIIGWLAATGIPLLSALIYRLHWPTAIVGLITLALSTIDGVLVEAVKSGLSGYDWRAAAGTAFVAFVVAALAHDKIWKNTAAESAAYSVGARTAYDPAMTVNDGPATLATTGPVTDGSDGFPPVDEPIEDSGGHISTAPS